MFNPNKALGDDEEGGKPALAIMIGASKKKPAYKPDAPLSDDSEEEGGGDADQRLTEACDIMAKMISAGRVDPTKLKKCLKEAFDAMEAMPHEENEEGETKNEGD